MKLVIRMLALTVLLATGLSLGQAHSAPAGPVRVSVYFQFGQATLTEEALVVLDEAAATVKEGGAARIQVIGRADKAGPEAVNRRIAAERAQVVKDALIARGVDGDKIETSAVIAKPGFSNAPTGFISERRTDVIIEPVSAEATGS